MRDAAPSPIEVPAATALSANPSRRLAGVLVFLQRLLRLAERPPRRLRLSESLALGERRFVAVIEFEQRRFLVGGTSQSLVLLAKLEGRGAGIDEPAAAEEQS